VSEGYCLPFVKPAEISDYAGRMFDIVHGANARISRHPGSENQVVCGRGLFKSSRQTEQKFTCSLPIETMPTMQPGTRS
jgi:hypothetical protein